jgi:hypothetical protein
MLKRSKKKPSLPSLVKKAWAAWSKHVRTQWANVDGYCYCVSCGKASQWTEMHAGHFVHCSKQSPLSYDPRNVHPQCVSCNYYGMQGLAAINYTQFIIKEYGSHVVDELKQMKHSKVYLKRAELEEIIERYS